MNWNRGRQIQPLRGAKRLLAACGSCDHTKLVHALQYSISLVLMAGLLYWAFYHVDLGDVATRIRDLSRAWIAIMVLITLFTLAMRGWRWMVLIHPFAPQVGLVDTSLALGICYAANVPIPRSGEVLRAVSLRWRRNASITSTLATVVVERILDLAWLLVFLGASLVLVRGRLEELIPGLGVICIVLLAACIVLLALLGFISLYRERALRLVAPPLRRLWPRMADRLLSLLHTFLQGLQALHSPAAYLQILISSVLLELGYAGIIWAAFRGFGFDIRYGLGASAALVIMVLSSVGVMIPTPGGAGSYHAFFAKPLLLLYAVDARDALACATAVHGMATLTYLAIGIPAFLLQRRSASKRRERTRSNDSECFTEPMPPAETRTGNR